MNRCLSLWLGEFPDDVPERDLCSSFSEVFFSLVSDRMRDSFSSPSCLGASHFSVKTKKNLLSSQISRIHNLFQLMLNRVAILALKGCLVAHGISGKFHVGTAA